MSASSSKNKIPIQNITLSAMFIAMALLLPFLTGQIPSVGKMLLPMHIPVMLCGFICGWPWGLAVGFVSPLLRSLIFSMPPMMPTAVAMAFELAAYGLVCGIMRRVLPNKLPYLYLDLIISMLAGRIVWGIAMACITGLTGTDFGFKAFISGAFSTALPGIALQLVIIPPIVKAVDHFLESKQ